MAESAAIERSVADEREASVVPAEEQVPLQAVVDQAGPSGAAFQSEKETDAQQTIISHGIIVTFTSF